MLNGSVSLCMFIPERLTQLIENSGLRRDALAEKADITVQTLYNYENGKREPSLDLLGRIAKVLQTSIAYLVGETDEPSAITLPRATVDKVMNTPFRASMNREKMKDMTDEEILASLKRVHEKQILIDLEEEYLKELKRRKNKE